MPQFQVENTEAVSDTDEVNKESCRLQLRRNEVFITFITKLQTSLLADSTSAFWSHVKKHSVDKNMEEGKHQRLKSTDSTFDSYIPKPQVSEDWASTLGKYV